MATQKSTSADVDEITNKKKKRRNQSEPAEVSTQGDHQGSSEPAELSVQGDHQGSGEPAN